jgi:hypothetical protein
VAKNVIISVVGEDAKVGRLRRIPATVEAVYVKLTPAKCEMERTFVGAVP